MKKVLIIDNYDSFTYNLLHAVEDIIGGEVHIIKNNKIKIEDVKLYEYILLSPGPGLPDEAGLLKNIIDTYKDSKKILGVCLGLQAIAEVYGCSLRNLNQVYHGIKSEITITQNSILFSKISTSFAAGRYHSWVIDEKSLSPSLLVTSREGNGQIMSIEHKTDKVYGVQFHPESIMTPDGYQILKNFLSS